MHHQHVEDFLECGVDEEGAARQHDEAVSREVGLQKGDLDTEERALEGLDQHQNHEEQHDAHADGEDHAELADPLLILGRHLLGFDGNVEEIVEAEHGFQRGQHQERHQVLDGEEIGHATAPRDSVP